MSWWLWLIIAVAVLVILTSGFLIAQYRRRGGGAVSARPTPNRKERP
ncbi:hypothetical protein [Parafrankia elaeagni]|nr:hypothetical protein [Parafrankia elaeagni]